MLRISLPTRYSAVVLLRPNGSWPSLSLMQHRAKLEQLEYLSVFANTFLAKKTGPLNSSLMMMATSGSNRVVIRVALHLIVLVTIENDAENVFAL
jgi:hypothetical protein